MQQLQHEAAEATEMMRQLTCALFKLKGFRDQGLRFRLRFRVLDRVDAPSVHAIMCISI